MAPRDEDGVSRLLLIEDDDGDALLVEELLADSGESYVIERAGSVAEAGPLIGGADCALVDLDLPDAHGLSAVEQVRLQATALPIVVLTGHAETGRGMQAVAAGAQDYLVKGRVDGPTLARAIRYSIERGRAERNARLLLVAEHRQAENDRLARGLLPLLDVDGPFEVVTRYRPGADALLGGDFYDALVTADGRLRLLVGDVCGHGPIQAALGVALRIAWRTLTLAGMSESDTLATVEQLLLRERDEYGLFATVCDVTIDPDGGTITVRCHGHPPPLLVMPEVQWVDEAKPAPPLGSVGPVTAVPATVSLPEGWGLLLLTDGIFEGRAEDGRLGIDGFAALVERLVKTEDTPDALLDSLVREAQELNGGDLQDDLALMWIGPG